MLTKLIKHEYIYLLKKFSPIYIVYIVSAVFVKLFTLIDIEISEDGVMFFTVMAVIFCVSTVFGVLTSVLALLTIADNIKRFKKNMFSDEGYLTNTLPVTATEHVVAKLIAGATNYVVSMIFLLLGMFIVETSGAITVLSEIKDIIEDSEPDVLLSLLLLSFVVYIAFILFGYVLTAINSMANSKGFVGAVVGFAGILFTIVAVSRIFALLVMSDIESVSVVFLVMSLFFALCAALMYFVLVNIMKKHLNLQ